MPRRLMSHTSAPYRIRLVKVLPADQAASLPTDEAAQVVEHALGLGEPLAADLRIALREVDEPFLDEAQRPPSETWHIRRRDSLGNPQVRPWVRGAGHQERVVERIDRAAIQQVAAEALAQPVPADRVATLAVIEIQHVRVRLLSADRDAGDHAELVRNEHIIPVALTRDAVGAWIDHVPDSVERPLQLTISNEDGALHVTLVLRWAPWTDRGAPEHAAVMSFAAALQADGFELDTADDVFR